MLYRALCGRLPFIGPDPLTLMYQHAHAPLPDPLEVSDGRVSPAFAAVLNRALAKIPADRFRDAPEMRSALEAIRHQVLTSPTHLGGGHTRIGQALGGADKGVLIGLLATAWDGWRPDGVELDSSIEKAALSAGTLPYNRTIPPAADTQAPSLGAEPSPSSAFYAEGAGESARIRAADAAPTPPVEPAGPAMRVVAGVAALLIAIALGTWLGFRERKSVRERVAAELRTPAVPAAHIGPAAPAAAPEPGAEAAQAPAAEAAAKADADAAAAPAPTPAAAADAGAEPADRATQLAAAAELTNDLGGRVALLKEALALRPDDANLRQALEKAKTDLGAARAAAAKTRLHRRDRAAAAKEKPKEDPSRSRIPAAFID